VVLFDGFFYSRKQKLQIVSTKLQRTKAAILKKTKIQDMNFSKYDESIWNSLGEKNNKKANKMAHVLHGPSIFFPASEYMSA
jgi:hypothetical protein